MKSHFARTALAGLAVSGLTLSLVACSDDDDDPIDSIEEPIDTIEDIDADPGDGTGLPGDVDDSLGNDTVAPEDTVPGDATTVAP
jgi:hypothetical protein